MDFPIEAEGENNLTRTSSQEPAPLLAQPLDGCTILSNHLTPLALPGQKSALLHKIWFGAPGVLFPNMLYKIIPRVIKASQCAQSPDCSASACALS